MRTFVAIEIPEETRKKVEALIETLKPTTKNVRWSRPGGLHITLKFIGEISPETVERAKSLLARLPTPAPFPVQMKGSGLFPKENAPRVIWAGIEAGPQLAKLARQIEDALLELDIPKENRDFSPHLTLGRLRNNDKLTALREVLHQKEPLEMGSFFADAFYLFESRPSSNGSVYQKLARFPFAAPSGSDPGNGSRAVE
jgi:2'-5' RNA ligase